MRMKKRVLIWMFFTLVMLLISFLVISISVSADASEITPWDGSSITQPKRLTVIDGTYYYEIATAEELAYIAKTGGDWIKYNYILTSDIVLNSVELTYDKNNGQLTVDPSTLNQWTGIGGFVGVFNGNGHTVFGIYGSYGLFSSSWGTVKNLSVKNSYIKSESEKVGGIVGYVANSANIYGCNFCGVVLGTKCVGGIAGFTGYAEINNCKNYGNIWATESSAGGIVGSGYGWIGSCLNEGNVFSAGDYAGGILGGGEEEFRPYDIDDCGNKGKITGRQYVGGITSVVRETEMVDCWNSGNITGTEYVGGLAGKSTGDSSISNGYNLGTITGTNYAGGIIGEAHGCSIAENYSAGAVVAVENVGGIAGYSDTIWGRGGRASGNFYLKTDAINKQINGFGNAEDIDGVTDAKDDSFFCINPDRTLNKSGHTYSAKCDATCNKCGYERQAAAHEAMPWKASGDSHWRECVDCGEKSDLGVHSGGEATCRCGPVCEICYKEYGVPDENNHSRSSFIYSLDATDPNKHDKKYACCGKVIEIQAHSGGEATCISKAICEVCKHAYGDIDADNHEQNKIVYASYGPTRQTQHAKKCACCGTVIELQPHSGGQATCVRKAICEACQQEYGEYAEHDPSDKWIGNGGSHSLFCRNGCGTQLNVEDCFDRDGDKRCDVCGNRVYHTSEKEADENGENEKDPQQGKTETEGIHWEIIIGASVGGAAVVAAITFFLVKKRKHR